MRLTASAVPRLRSKIAAERMVQDAIVDKRKAVLALKQMTRQSNQSLLEAISKTPKSPFDATKLNEIEEVSGGAFTAND